MSDISICPLRLIMQCLWEGVNSETIGKWGTIGNGGVKKKDRSPPTKISNFPCFLEPNPQVARPRPATKI